MQPGKIVALIALALVSGLLLAGCTSSPRLAFAGVNSPNTTLFYKKPTDGELHAVKVPLTRLQVGMTRETMLHMLKPIRLLSINYHGDDAQNTYWLRPGIKITLHFSNRDPLLVVPDELPHGEPDDVLLDLPDAIVIAAGPNVPDPQKSWQKVLISDLN